MAVCMAQASCIQTRHLPRASCPGFFVRCRDKPSPQGQVPANDDLELLLAAAAHAPEPCDHGRQVVGQHNGMLHEAAAAADQYAPGPPHFFSSLLVIVLASCSCHARAFFHSCCLSPFVFIYCTYCALHFFSHLHASVLGSCMRHAVTYRSDMLIHLEVPCRYTQSVITQHGCCSARVACSSLVPCISGSSRGRVADTTVAEATTAVAAAATTVKPIWDRVHTSVVGLSMHCVCAKWLARYCCK